MPSLIGYVDNTGSEGLAHWQMLETIRRFACGYGTLAAAVFAGTGNGTLNDLDSQPGTVTETWTIACTDVTTPGAEVWSVTGSVSGAQANATTGVAYANAMLAFQIAAGATPFVVGDHWTVDATQGALSAAGQAWTQLRYLTPTDGTNRELILRGPGLSGDQQIYVGLRAYYNVSADYYNLSVAGFTGYVDGNAFTAQPGYFESGIPAHNLRIDYWLTTNGQRIAFGMKVGTPVYEHGYVGYFLPYATPGQYPYPLVVGGMLNGVAATRFSDSTHSMYAKGTRANLQLRFVDGSWKQPDSYPWINPNLTSATPVRDTDGVYPLLPVVLNNSAPNVFGELDGIYQISGFNNVTENTLAIDGVNYVVLQDVARNGFTDYYALELS